MIKDRCSKLSGCRITALLFLLFPACLGSVEPKDIRPPAVAGAFYPADSAELSRMVVSFFSGSRLIQPRVKPAGLLCPHAGYIYSGAVAGAAFRQLQGYTYKTVVVVAPSHVEAFEFSSVYCRGAYQTPLGTIPVDTLLAGELVRLGGSLVRCSDRGHRQEQLSRSEHALEVELPFLQVALGAFKLVPVIMGTQNLAAVRALAEALAGAVGGRDDVLLVASSDLSHFHTAEQADRLDGRLRSLVQDFDYQGLIQALDRQETEACGGGPLVAVMMACGKLGAGKARIVAHANSGDVTGDKSQVVGYLSAMFYSPRKEESSHLTPNSGNTMSLTDQEKEYLLKLARKSIYSAVLGEPAPEAEAITPVMAELRGAFVTIKKSGQLRGCIGYIQAVKPLAETVREMAVSAALHDPRFVPVSPKELDQLELEISVLSPIRQVQNLDSIQVGRDGLIVRRGPYQGLLLPQVATEYGWDRKTFLSQTCRKAGLPLDAWEKEGTLIESFSAEVFGEKEP